MVARALASMQENIMGGAARRAEAAQAAADHLKASANIMVAPGMHLEEFEINDYPQVARQRISHREPLLQIEEMTGAKLWVKGQYFGSNVKIPEGCRKLYVE